MSVYLDYNASTPVEPAVLEAMIPCFRELHGNPSSSHSYGQRARSAVMRARAQVAEIIGANSENIFFVSGGTEANNMAILSALANKPGGLVVSEIEHPSVYNLAHRLRRDGVQVTFLGVDNHGRVSLGSLEAALKSRDISLVSIMAANNETGVIQPVAEIAKLCSDNDVWFHCDAAQAVGKIEFDINTAPADMVTISPHKFGGPIGVGALYVRTRSKLKRLFEGGGQESNRRPGTEAVALIVGFGEACSLALERMPEIGDRLRSLRDRMESEILDQIDGYAVYGAEAERLPNTSNISFSGVSGELLVRSLDQAGFAVSTGSACHSGEEAASRVLNAMGVGEDLALGSIRISFGPDTTSEDVGSFVDALAGIVDELRRKFSL